MSDILYEGGKNTIIQANEKAVQRLEQIAKMDEQPKVPDNVVPVARYRYVIIKRPEYEIPLNRLEKKGSIIMPEATQQARVMNFMQQIYEIVSIGPDVANSKDAAGNCPGADLKVGQWVAVSQASVFVFFAQQYFSLTPEFISAVVKEPEQDFDEIIEQFV